jgi:hypothetical protein
VSFFVIIVVIPYLIAVVAFLKPFWPERFTREWHWESRRHLEAAP